MASRVFHSILIGAFSFFLSQVSTKPWLKLPATIPNPTSSSATYGTLKRGFYNHKLTKELIDQDDAVFIGPYITRHTYPLVCGPHGIQYLINLPGSGHRINGELYALVTRGLARFDELEGTSVGLYERLTVVGGQWGQRGRRSGRGRGLFRSQKLR
ncbi:putative gamma-glutamylcyclotransferase [Rosa chinensis]|uniref:Gamma-glutamylcyclotransferase family protein n=1 Tax=Rosa chinensis TaxID=74649 RepID=A0A2P6PA18_ROSCH|nr:putative gamma-glutamylcyclotransferase [Rosa chinensis]